MLWRSSELTGCHIQATDGPIGHVVDLLFDNTTWALRWAVVDTANWLPGRRVLLPPAVFGQPDTSRRQFPVNLTQESVRKSPDVESDVPVSRQMETWLYRHYGWTPYWDHGPFVPASPAAAFYPALPPDGPPSKDFEALSGDPHLHSVKEVTGYTVEARDARAGQVQEFLVEDGVWAIRYAVIDAKTWWPGGLVLVAPQWITEISWTARQIHIDQLRAQIKEAPEYHPSESITRDFEKRLFAAYGANPYWTI